MKIYGVRVWVDDMAAAKRFYGETLGLKAKWEMAVAVGYDVGIDLIVELDEGGEDSLVGRFVGVSIQVDDIQATFEALKAKGVPFLAPPEKMSWGGTLAHFKDPAGNTLTLIQ